MRYVEINAVSKTIYLKEIPKHYYEGMKLLNPNTGMTSFVFEKDKNTVRIFTKDDMKKEWLCHEWGLNIGDHIDDINNTKYKDIHIIDMPKLYPLSQENKKIANEIIKAVKNADKAVPKGVNANRYDIFNKIYDEMMKLKGKAKKILNEFYEFLINYDPNHDFGLDISIRNFKQTKRGKLVLLDPVADKELLKLYFLSKK